ncbi:hypothetical protein [Halobacillus naozhouensis]|uniref:Uncharacterized protein n=1 Tax=Halobacillus naozhouensis TaxID=554880 RepID=A0ABY8IYB1_9BACI|nr:hypothetical protein [Halobacillus naozhouensis]WFT74812.1 hypothetical protein P9989_21160 [Halobacillus naozhouensis]
MFPKLKSENVTVIYSYIDWILTIIYFNSIKRKVQGKTLNSLPKQWYPDGIASTQTIQQVAGAIGIAVMVLLLATNLQ